jgi:16S rRNA (uracil1498-N3)-methyltransferase
VSLHRFFAPALDLGDESVALPRDEAEHLTRVLRLSTGDTVAVFDGRGHEFRARVIVGASRRDVRVELVSRIEPAREPAVPITLVQAVLKGDKMDEVVRDAVMLGAAAVHPIVSKRSETTVAAAAKSRLERWRRVALASVKQSRRATLPDIRLPLGFEDFLGEPSPALTLMLIEPPSSSAAIEPIGRLRDDPIPTDAAVLVGPEGGWTPEECDLAAQKGVRLITLGHRTLRADAVPVAAISILQFLWGDL